MSLAVLGTNAAYVCIVSIVDEQLIFNELRRYYLWYLSKNIYSDFSVYLDDVCKAHQSTKLLTYSIEDFYFLKYLDLFLELLSLLFLLYVCDRWTLTITDHLWLLDLLD